MKASLRLGAFFVFGLLCMAGQHLYGQTVLLNYFNLSPTGSDVILEWEIQAESGVVEYRVFRKFNNEPLQAHIATLAPNGSGKYQYLDDDIFKSETQVIHYELQVLMANGQTLPFQATLSHNPTSVQRTWGSIKSMFR